MSTAVFVHGAEAYREALNALKAVAYQDNTPEDVRDAILAQVRTLYAGTVMDAMPSPTDVQALSEALTSKGVPHAFCGAFALNFYAHGVALSVRELYVLVERIPREPIESPLAWRPQVANTDLKAQALREAVPTPYGDATIPVLSRTRLWQVLTQEKSPLLPYLPKDP